jgi:two-component system, cell cycle sensor histidine kinase and response regulator CckA
VNIIFVAEDGRAVLTEGTIGSRKQKGSPAACYGFFHDITGRKQIEDQLRHAQKMEAVGQLAGGIAHDFNNILTAITGYASMMLMKTEQESPHRFTLEQIIAAARRGAGLTRGMLTYSRKQIIDLKPVDLNVIVKNVANLLQRVIGEEIDLKTALTKKDIIIRADSGQIEQVLMNLATNARDSISGQGLLLIETDTVGLTEKFITVHGYGNRGSYARLCFSDSGRGMDEKIRLRIFEPFFTTKEVGKGTGLGLAIVYGLVKQHNGYINVYSEPGKGTTFKIYLPLAGADGTVATASEERDDLPRGSEMVLLAEDDELSRRMIRQMLHEFGYRVIEAVDGEDAVRKFSQRREEIQIVIFDVVMPKLDGKTAYDAIIRENPQVKALFISGYTADMIHKRGILHPGVNFMSKPVSPEGLLKKIRDVLDESR